MKDHGLKVERPRQPLAIEISEDVDELSSLSSYPVKVGTNRTCLRFSSQTMITIGHCRAFRRDRRREQDRDRTCQIRCRGRWRVVPHLYMGLSPIYSPQEHIRGSERL